MQKQIKTQEDLLRAQQLLHSSCQMQGKGRELHLDLNLLCFNLNQRSPAKEGADSECLGVGALFVGPACHPVGLSLLLSCLLHALGLSFCP